MTREELIEVMARAILQDHEDGANMDTHPVPERAATRHALAALAAIEAAGVRLVPAESTRGMYDAGNAVCVNAWRQGSSANADVVYAEMLAVSPYAALKETGQ